jgi:hypothetical protein
LQRLLVTGYFENVAKYAGSWKQVC